MKTLERLNRNNTKYFRSYLLMITLAGFVLTMTSCEDDWRGVDGRPGQAFVSVAWEVAQPDYLDTGSPDVPAYFQWGRFYPANPGVYFLYYEGRIPNGYGYSLYAWEIEYSIWINMGEPGGYHYHGADGPDNYFTLVCSPYGPYIDNYYKSGDLHKEVEIEKLSETEFKVKSTGKDFSFEAIYRKVDPKNIAKSDSSKNSR